MTFIKPEKLKKGDVIGIISPASSPEYPLLINDGVKYIESLGYRTELGKNVGKNLGYLAGTDEERIEDIHYMFKNKNIKAVICLRGGYGAARLLDRIDYKLIRKNPKIFVGYSEITSLQMAFLSRSRLITFAGPMVVPDFSKNVSSYTEENFWRLITSAKKVGPLKYLESGKLSKLKKGNATGFLVGGNLAVFASLLGTRYLPNLKGKILFLEDVNELPYKIDRMMNQLKLNNVFKQVAGIILGSFVDCKESDPSKKTISLEEIFKDYISEIKVPSVYSFPHGHIKNFITIPIGIRIKLNASKGTIDFTESCVR